MTYAEIRAQVVVQLDPEAPSLTAVLQGLAHAAVQGAVWSVHESCPRIWTI